MKINNVIIFGVVLWMSVASTMAQPAGNVIDEVIAVIGNNIILKSDLESQIASMRAQGVLIDDKMRCELLEELMYQKLLLRSR